MVPRTYFEVIAYPRNKTVYPRNESAPRSPAGIRETKHIKQTLRLCGVLRPVSRVLCAVLGAI